MATIPFNKPYMTGKELWYIAQTHANGYLADDGSFTKRCQAWLEARTGAVEGAIHPLLHRRLGEFASEVFLRRNGRAFSSRTGGAGGLL